MMDSVILSALVYDSDFARRVIPFLKDEYFADYNDKKLFNITVEYINKYNTLPTKEALKITLSDLRDVTESQSTAIAQKIDSLSFDSSTDANWLLEQTEKFCQDKAIYNAVKESILVLDGENKKLDRGSIPQLLSDALAVSFDPEVGHDFLEDFSKRYDFYHTKENKISFDLEMMNLITKGGISKKSLCVALASCVHPDTPIRIRLLNGAFGSLEKIIKISNIKELSKSDSTIQVSSPDGWVSVIGYVEKDPVKEHILYLDNGMSVRCAPEHLFETTFGWEYAKDLALIAEKQHFLTQDGWSKGNVITTDNIIPIVDIMVDHPNHRYYTNGVSSHNTGVGKTLLMTHFASANLMAGLNVLYITLEMEERKIAERIDANLLDLTIDDLHQIPKEAYVGRISKVMKQTTGRLVIKEYPTTSANVNHFRYLLNELKLKKKFIPDIIYIDYLNLCASSRVKMSGSVNSYTYIKSIAEELRGLAVEYNLPIFTATQSNREGANNSDIDLTNTSESWGLPATADFMIALISTESLESVGQILIKQLKNRWGDISKNKKFVVGIDRSKMRLYNVDNPEEGLVEDTPVMSKTSFGMRDENDTKKLTFSRKKKPNVKFEDFV
jgi:KaiC/GvpD/RAD55 family RecA-like ATPase